ncbi:MAG: GLPGLI family protein [Saprospiraceae bacterium]|nr:GLPGLI family protein [Saprospiraceae bacterium]
MQQLLVSFLLFLMLQAPVSAQETSATEPFTEGSIRYLITHNWTKKLAALSYMSKQRKERAAYMWGSRAEWSEYALLHVSPTTTKYVESEERVDPDDEGWSWRKETFFTQRNFAQNTFYDALTLQGKTYLVQDSLQCQEWKILNDLKEVAGHLCMNAVWVDTVKEQKIVAWFALDIPHSGGPERLCGLPGLILEADYNDGAMIVSANRIEAKKLGDELTLPKKIKGKKVNHAAYQSVLSKEITRHKKEEEPYFWSMRY